jgi:hypothetical protein
MLPLVVYMKEIQKKKEKRINMPLNFPPKINVILGRILTSDDSI